MSFLMKSLHLSDAHRCLRRLRNKSEAVVKVHSVPASKYAALSEHDKYAYTASRKAYRDAYAIAETERSEGRAEGKAEGRAEGRAEERKNNFKAMISFGITTEQIAKKFGLSEDEVLKIIQ